jgi:hypothetical protein
MKPKLHNIQMKTSTNYKLINTISVLESDTTNDTYPKIPIDGLPY